MPNPLNVKQNRCKKNLNTKVHHVINFEMLLNKASQFMSIS